MKKICFTIPTMEFGGMQRVISILCNYYAKNGYKVYLFVIVGKSIFYNLDDNVNVIYPKKERKSNNKFFYSLYIMFFFRDKIKEIKPNYIICFGSYHSFFLAMAVVGLKQALFISERQTPHLNRGFVTEQLKKIFYPRITGDYAQTRYVKNYIEKTYGAKNVFVVPNPMEKAPFSNDFRQKIIVRTGRLVPEKRFDLLLDIFAEVKDTSWKLVLVGDGPCKKELEKKALTLGIIERVIFEGTQKNVYEYLNKAQIFAFTSEYEGFPNALCEGMSAGLACISFDIIAGPSDIINDGQNGFLIPEGNKELFITKLNELVNSEELRRKFSEEGSKLNSFLSVENISHQIIKKMNEQIVKQKQICKK